MGEPGVADSGGAMPKACSEDLRKRVIEAVKAGGSRCGAAKRFAVSASSAVKWVARWRRTGAAAARPAGGSRSPLEDHAELLLGLLAEQPDRTLDELRELLRERGVPGGGRTGVRPVQGRQRLPPVQLPRLREGRSGMDPRLRCP